MTTPITPQPGETMAQAIERTAPERKAAQKAEMQKLSGSTPNPNAGRIGGLPLSAQPAVTRQPTYEEPAPPAVNVNPPNVTRNGNVISPAPQPAPQPASAAERDANERYATAERNLSVLQALANGGGTPAERATATPAAIEAAKAEVIASAKLKANRGIVGDGEQPAGVKQTRQQGAGDAVVKVTDSELGIAARAAKRGVTIDVAGANALESTYQKQWKAAKGDPNKQDTLTRQYQVELAEFFDGRTHAEGRPAYLARKAGAPAAPTPVPAPAAPAPARTPDGKFAPGAADPNRAFLVSTVPADLLHGYSLPGVSVITADDLNMLEDAKASGITQEQVTAFLAKRAGK